MRVACFNEKRGQVCVDKKSMSPKKKKTFAACDNDDTPHTV